MKLWETTDRLEYIFAECVDEDGSMTQETAHQLDHLEDEREKLILNLLLYYQGEKLEGEAVATAAKELSARATTHQARAQWIKDYITSNIEEPTDLLPKGERFKDARVKTSWRTGVSVEVINEELVPEGYIHTVIHTSIDKTAAKGVLKKGGKIPGLQLETKYHLQIK